ncbi:hemin binding protein [Bartonella australis AUST/NH1]|uniref:Hemin binding protein n=1 Tax=Bartonella australis (strain Aust/NH1) TaxID=1094489 RepID=M1P378_BARAA|nr:outer membrane protein [Bartonella australis]AGF74280.1 hemin binding protein [Bartonella australis AUST/NH1]
MTIRYLVTVSVLAMLSSSAARASNAAALGDHEEIVLAPNFSWTGFYIGGQIGNFSSKTALNHLDNRSPGREWVQLDKESTPKLSGFVGGFYAGSDIAFDDGFILGVDTDIMWSNKKQKKAFFTGRKSGEETVTNAYTLKKKWSGATRVRGGMALGRAMPYIAGGIAYTQLKSIYSETLDRKVEGPIFSEDNTRTMIGYTLGGGLDYAMTGDIILRAEYRYSDFGKKKFEKGRTEIHHKTNDFRIGASYKF